MFRFLDMVKTLAERTRQILEEQSINQVELAKVAGCTKGLVNQWLNESVPDKEMRARYAFNIAERYGYELRWLTIGEGRERTPSAMNHRINNLIDNYARCDERGRATILTVAEREAQYGEGDSNNG